MEYREAVLEDLEALVDKRMEFVSAVCPGQATARLRADTEDYFRQHLGAEDFLVFLARDGQNIAALAMACLFTLMPLPSCPSGRQAELLNVYTAPAYRRQGHAEALLRRLMAEAKARGVEKLLLFYTDEGLPLYEKLGFIRAERDMALLL